MVRHYLVVLLCLFSLQSFSNEITVFEHPEILKQREALSTLKTSLEYHLIAEALEVAVEYPTKELYQVLRERIERLPDASRILDVPDLNLIVEAILKVYGNMGTSWDIDLLNDFNEWVKADLRNNELSNYISRMVIVFRGIKNSDRSFPSLEELNRALIKLDGGKVISRVQVDPKIEQRNKAHLSALAQVDRFYQKMKSYVIGQEEILRSFKTLYLNDLLKDGNRTQPEVFYFMGLPGNGKDTLAEAYVDALYGQKGAYQDHMFRMNIRTKQEAWSYFGSAKGYIGSEEIPAFLRFLVEHSGGKYYIAKYTKEKGEKPIYVIEKNPTWTPEESFLMRGPHKAVVFINEAHNIPKEVKDNVLKQAIERGIFPVNNPGATPNAVSTIELPVTFIFASNEGIELLEPRQINGSRIGPPLTFERIHENYMRVHADKPLLKSAIFKINGGINSRPFPDGPGISEEFLNRIPDHRLHILEPLSPDQLIEVARYMAADKSKALEDATGRLGNYKVEISDEMFRFMVEYNYIAAENARPIKARLDRFIFEPIDEAIESRKIRPYGRMQTIRIELKKYENGAHAAVFKVTDSHTGEEYQFSRLIRETLNEIPKSPLSQDRINQILQMRQTILQNVFGVEHIVDRLMEAAIVSESEARNAGESKRPATVMAFLGMTSTGKSETAKQYARARYGDRERPIIIDFNGVRSLETMEAKILGSYDSYKNPIASDFMKAYDRAIDGNLTFIFDEAANSPKELLKALYEILREPVATGFSDGKPRPMKNVTIILTGNAGEQIYGAIPKGLPTDVHERAMHEVFRIFINNEDLQQRILKETFPEAMIARLGRNIFHFGPLNDQSKRQVAQLKLEQALKGLEPKRSERGWNLSFSTESDLLRLFDMIEKQGFHVSQQGASIDRFVRESIVDKIKSRLLVDGVPSGEQIIVEVADKNIVKQERDLTYLFREVKLFRANGQQISIEVPIGKSIDSPKKNNVDRVLTAYHEAGHEIVSEVYFGDRVRPKYLSIIEGVALIGESLVHYAGLRAGRFIEDYRYTKEVVLREAAVLTGGYVAQQLVTYGARHDAGKNNDMHRATQLVQSAILRYGLSKEWGTRSVPSGMTMDDFIDKELSLTEKEQLNRITNRWLKEAETLAREALLINMDGLFVNMSQEIARRGYLNEKDIMDLYEKYGVVTERSGEEYTQKMKEVRWVHENLNQAFDRLNGEFTKRYTYENLDFNKSSEAYNWLFKKNLPLTKRLLSFNQNPWSKLTPLQKTVAAALITGRLEDSRRDAHLSWEKFMPDRVADIKKIINDEREKATRPVTQVEKFVSEASQNTQPEKSRLTENSYDFRVANENAPIDTEFLRSPSSEAGGKISCARIFK